MDISIFPEELKEHILSYLPYEYLFIIRKKLSRPKNKEIEMWLFSDFQWELLDKQLSYDRKFTIEICKNDWYHRDTLIFNYVFRNPDIQEMKFIMKYFGLKGGNDILSIIFKNLVPVNFLTYILKTQKDIGISYETWEELCKTNELGYFIPIFTKFNKNAPINLLYNYCLQNESYDIIEYLENYKN